MPIYLTEFGVQSKPNKQLGVSVAKQAEYDAIAEHIAYSNPRVAAFSQYLLKDDPLGGAPGASVHGGTVGFQTGLEYVNGTPKPLYYGWPMPLTVTKRAPRRLAVGPRAPRHGATKVTVLVQPKGSKRYRTLRTITTNSLGYWSFNSSTAGPTLARALDEPRRRHLRRSADPRLLKRAALAVEARPAQGRSRGGLGRETLGIPTMRGDARAARGRDHGAPARRRRCRGAQIESALAPGINALKTFDPPLSALEGERIVGGAPARQAPDRATADPASWCCSST